jgi:hypothetical protein
MSPLDRDAASAEALLTDLYLDALLAGAVLDAASEGSADGPAGRLDPAARHAADRLRRDLVRVHPSFRFEERLATRLAEAAIAMRVPAAAGAEGRVVPFRTPAYDGDPLAPAEGAEDSSPRELARPLLIGGALTSAALSIAGAALVAWRRGRPGRSTGPMVRAARAVRSGRPGGSRAGTLGGPRRSSGPRSVRRLD